MKPEEFMDLWGKLDREARQEQKVDAIVQGKLATRILSKRRSYKSERKASLNRFKDNGDDSDTEMTADFEGSGDLSGELNDLCDSGVPGISEDALNLISDMDAPSRSYIAQAHTAKKKQIRRDTRNSRRRGTVADGGLEGAARRRRATAAVRAPPSRRTSTLSASSTSSSRRSSCQSIEEQGSSSKDLSNKTKHKKDVAKVQVMSLRAGIQW